MEYGFIVGVGHTLKDALEGPGHPILVVSASIVQRITEAPTFRERHDEPGHAALETARVKNCHHVRMVEVGQNLDLPSKPLSDLFNGYVFRLKLLASMDFLRLGVSTVRHTCVDDPEPPVAEFPRFGPRHRQISFPVRFAASMFDGRSPSAALA